MSQKLKLLRLVRQGGKIAIIPNVLGIQVVDNYAEDGTSTIFYKCKDEAIWSYETRVTHCLVD